MDKEDEYINNRILLSHKEGETFICSNMYGPTHHHTKSDKERQISYDITYMWNLKHDINALI